MLLLLTVISIALSSVYASDGCYKIGDAVQPSYNLSVPMAFIKYKIVKDYLPVPPQDLLEAGYSSVNIQLGTKFSPPRTFNPTGREQTYVRYPKAVQGQRYALILLDIDAPSPSNPKRAYIQGLFLNCPFDDFLGGNIVVPYVASQPTPGSGYHRYVSLVYRQSGNINPNTTSLFMLAKNRERFSVVNFAKEYNLTGPMAGNFFLAQYTMCESRQENLFSNRINLRDVINRIRSIL
ncbi:unnamed protein product [Colias eurytheme]|nr:unnamed protein product [Colias eurytheme]